MALDTRGRRTLMFGGAAIALGVPVIVIANRGDAPALTPPSTTLATSTTVAPDSPPTNPVTAANACNTGRRAPARYAKVVVFSFENRSWDEVGGVGFAAMPFAQSLANSCSYFTTWTEAVPGQNSASQYVGQTQGDATSTVLNDCRPSSTCNSQADNIFRQARTAGKRAINYVEGPTEACSATGNKTKHIPALYFWGDGDLAACSDQVLPYSDFDPLHLAAFSFISPSKCHDGHDCDNAVVDT